MKKTLIGFLFIIIVLSCSIRAFANYPGSYVNTDGYYVYTGDSYYWNGNNAYTRYWVSTPGYYCGSYYPSGYYRYTYHHAHVASVYTTPVYSPTVNYTDPGWRSKLLDIAAARDKAEAQIRKNAFEQAYFKEAVQTLGLTGNFRWDSYGVSPPYSYSPIPSVPYGSYGSLQYSSAGVNGSTLYGQTYNSIASVYGDANLSQLYQQANRLAENAQKLSGQAVSDFGSLVGNEGQNRAKIAEILARSQAAAEFLKSLEAPSGKVETKTFTFKVVPGADGKMQIQKMEQPQVPIMPNVNEDVGKLWEQSATKCLTCHSGVRKDGGFDVTQYRTLSPQQKMVVIGRLTTKDASKRMPRTADGKAFDPMPDNELDLWFKN